MIIKKLSWAGIQVKAAGTQILIDPINSVPDDEEIMYTARMGHPLEAIFELKGVGKPDAIFITHIHPDHFDPDGIKKEFGNDIPLFLPIESTKAAYDQGFTNVTGLNPGDKTEVKDILVQAIPAVDGFGTPQISYGVTYQDHSIFHAGDTLWHGLWWQIARKFGPFDLACLPVNGAVLSIPGLSVQSDVKACLNPEEAVNAAKILGASHFLPIHYATFHNPPYYMETEHVIPRLKESASQKDIILCLLKPGEEINMENN